MTTVYPVGSQNDLLLQALLKFYKNEDYLNTMLKIINGDSEISLRIVDWFATNYSKQYLTNYSTPHGRFKVYQDYKLKLRAYSKRRFDPFCRWERIQIPYSEESCIQTTLGQLNFFRWAIENKVIDFISKNYSEIELDMNSRNSSSKRRQGTAASSGPKTRKKREELSKMAARAITRERVPTTISFN